MEQKDENETKEESPPPVSLAKPIRKTFKTFEGQYKLVHECLHETKIAKLAKERSYKITSLSASPSHYIHPCRISLVVAKNVEYLSSSNSSTNLRRDEKRAEEKKLNEGDTKRTEEKGKTSTKKEAHTEYFYLINSGDSIFLQPFSAPFYKQKKRADSTLRFRAMPSCHDFNRVASTSSSLSLVIGFMSGDILTHDPKTNSKTVQFNREKCISAGRVNCIQWIPGSKTLFMAAFSTGNMFIFDMEREDQSFSEPLPDGSVNSFVLHQEGKFNPVSRWHICKSAINDFSFSPDGQHLAVASQDGFLRVYEFETEKYLAAYRSYYGGFLCVAWSPDSKYLLTGGEDDLVSVWSFPGRRLIARGRGHESFVSRVLFDPWNCSAERYRFASVGQDARLILWDFAINEELHLPRSRSNTFNKRQSGSLLRDSKDSLEPKFADAPKPVVIPTKLNIEIPFLQPLVSHRAHSEPISDVVFLHEAIVTVCWGGITKYWCRPSFLAKLPNELEETEKKTNPEALKSLPSSALSPRSSSPSSQEQSTQTVHKSIKDSAVVLQTNGPLDNHVVKTPIKQEVSSSNGRHDETKETVSVTGQEKTPDSNGVKTRKEEVEPSTNGTKPLLVGKTQ